MAGLGHHQIEAGLGWDEEQGLEFEGAFDAVVDGAPGGFGFVGEVLIEGFVLFGLDLGLVAFPEGGTGVDGLGLVVFLVILLAGFGDIDGVGDEVGVLADEAFDAPTGEVFVLVFAEAQDDGGTGGLLGAFVEFVGAVSGGAPADGRLSGSPVEGLDGDGFGDHKGSVEADAELADEFGNVALVVLAEGFGEGLGAGGGDGAEILLKFLGGHTDAVVGDGDGLGGLVDGDVDAVVFPALGERLVGKRAVAGAVDGVGSVGDQFPQEDLFLGVERVNHQIQHTADFGLELMGCFSHRKILSGANSDRHGP